MKRILSFILVVIFVFSISSSVSATIIGASAPVSESVSFENADGVNFRIDSKKYSQFAVTEVYIDGVFAQESTAYLETEKVVTSTYDPKGELTSISSIAFNDIRMTSLNNSANCSSCSTLMDNNSLQRSIWDEPVDNVGLDYAYYENRMSYYYLGTGRYSASFDMTADLYRAYTFTYDGESHYWNWGPDMTISAIGAIISLFGGPVSAIIGLLVFTAAGYLSYANSVELATYTHDYHYQVKIDGTSYFDAIRNITYWRIDNYTTGVTKWEQKRFNYGFSADNSEMIRAGINAYYLMN